MKSGKSGYTLTEIMTVVLIIGVLIAVAVPSFAAYRKRAQANACRVNMRMVKSAVEEARLERDPALASGTDNWESDYEFDVDSSSFLVVNGFLSEPVTCPTDGSKYSVSLEKMAKGFKVNVACTASGVEGHDISNGQL